MLNLFLHNNRSIINRIDESVASWLLCGGIQMSYFSLTCPICGRIQVFQDPSSVIPVLICGPHNIKGKQTMIHVGSQTREKIAKELGKKFDLVTTA